jgi:hypothetical protein
MNWALTWCLARFYRALFCSRVTSSPGAGGQHGQAGYRFIFLISISGLRLLARRFTSGRTRIGTTRLGLNTGGVETQHFTLASLQTRSVQPNRPDSPRPDRFGNPVRSSRETRPDPKRFLEPLRAFIMDESKLFGEENKIVRRRNQNCPAKKIKLSGEGIKIVRRRK